LNIISSNFCEGEKVLPNELKVGLIFTKFQCIEKGKKKLIEEGDREFESKTVVEDFLKALIRRLSLILKINQRW
jgi:hypothetical protein